MIGISADIALDAAHDDPTGSAWSRVAGSGRLLPEPQRTEMPRSPAAGQPVKAPATSNEASKEKR